MLTKIRKHMTIFKKKLNDRRGFDLMQLMFYMAIASMLILLSVGSYSKIMEFARETTCESDIKTTGDAVTRYYMEIGSLPDASSFEALRDELIKDDVEVNGRKYGPWMKENMNVTDPWGQPFEYTEKGGGKFDICSKGAPDGGKQICYNTLGRSSK